MFFSLWGQWLHLSVSALWRNSSHGLLWTLFMVLYIMTILTFFIDLIWQNIEYDWSLSHSFICVYLIQRQLVSLTSEKHHQTWLETTGSYGLRYSELFCEIMGFASIFNNLNWCQIVQWFLTISFYIFGIITSFWTSVLGALFPFSTWCGLLWFISDYLF